MLTAYLFDHQHGKKVEEWSDAVQNLRENEVLWLDLRDPTADEEQAVREALELEELDCTPLAEPGVLPLLEQHDRYIRVTALGVAGGEDNSDFQAVAVDCFVGENWVATAHTVDVEVIEQFRERAEGGGEVGILDAPSFLAGLLEWVVTSYLRAFDEIDLKLEAFELSVLKTPPRDAEEQIGVLIDVRRQVGKLRRSLAPHREVFAALSHSEFDPISTEESAERFGELSAKVDQALITARDTKDAVIGSFDVLLARTGYRTNEIMKILTLASVLLLPGALIAGVAGMNVNLSTGVFVHSPLFWIVCSIIGLMGLTALGFARARRWI